MINNDMNKNAIIMKSLLKSRTLEDLKDMAKRIMADHRDGADTALQFTLNELEARLGDGEFVKFCGTL